MCLLCGTGGQLMHVRPCCSQVCWQIPHLHSTVLTARHYERCFHPGQKHMQRWKVIPQFPSFFEHVHVLVDVIRNKGVAAGMLPGAGDGAHSIRVAGAPGHTVHLTTVTVHLPHAY